MEMKEQQETACNLLQQLPHIADIIFDRNNFKDYLDLAVRLDYLEYYNLLLIYFQFPNAELVAGQKTWEMLYSGEGEALKRNYPTYGMYVVVPCPFENASKGIYLSFISVKVYDITQTNIIYYRPSETIYKPSHSFHLKLLLRAITSYITNELHHRVSFELPKERYRFDLPGRITQHTVTIKETLSVHTQVLWLTEALAFLYYLHIRDETYSEAFETLYIYSLCYMLLSKWQINHSEIYLPDTKTIRSIPNEMREEFCKVLQEGYRQIENTIQSLYFYLKFYDSEPFDEDI